MIAVKKETARVFPEGYAPTEALHGLWREAAMRGFDGVTFDRDESGGIICSFCDFVEDGNDRIEG